MANPWTHENCCGWPVGIALALTRFETAVKYPLHGQPLLWASWGHAFRLENHFLERQKLYCSVKTITQFCTHPVPRHAFCHVVPHVCSTTWTPLRVFEKNHSSACLDAECSALGTTIVRIEKYLLARTLKDQWNYASVFPDTRPSFHVLSYGSRSPHLVSARLL